MKIDETMEMSYPRELVEQIILGLTDPLNQHLIKLIGFDFPPHNGSISGARSEPGWIKFNGCA